MRLKTKKVIATIVLMTSAFLIGRLTSINSDAINMNQVTDIQADADGVQITLSDGNGYYWER